MTDLKDQNIFFVTNSDLTRLDEKEAVLFVRDLLWSEARRLNIPLNKINATEEIYVPDGGIDASVEYEVVHSESNIFFTGLNGYQLKSGENFSPDKAKQLRNELYKKQSKEYNSENLKVGIKKCLDKNGSYIIICTGLDLTTEQRDKAKDELEKILKNECKYQSPKIDVWSQSQLKAFISIFPSLCLKVNQRDNAFFQSHDSWSFNEDVKKPFVHDNAQIKLIEQISGEVAGNTDSAQHLRLLGEPGNGKTRLAFEALNTDYLRPLVIYTNARSFQDSVLMNEILKSDNSFNLILVLDECDEDALYYVWNRLKNRGPRIKLISIYNEPSSRKETNIFYAPLLSDEKIGEIITKYGVPLDQANRFASLCSGSPRVAHVVGLNLKNNPDDLLKNPEEVDVWGKYIIGSEDRRSERVRKRMIVLKYISLFKKVGLEDSSGDYNCLFGIVKEADSSITDEMFKEILIELKNRRILQGTYVYYITPKLLQIWLWTEFWKTHNVGFEFEDFASHLTPNLLQNFFEIFKYARASDATMSIIDQLFGQNGPYKDDQFLKTRLGANFFLNLTRAAPKLALKCLKRLLSNKTKDELLAFTTGRRQVVWALEYTGQFAELFTDSIRLLLHLAEAENETYSNNATGVFQKFFSLGWGELAPTETPPIERLKLVKDILTSNNSSFRLLALKAIDSSLSENLIRDIGLEREPLSEQPKRWTPKTYGEIYESLDFSWNLLVNELDTSRDKEKAEIINIISHNLHYISRFAKLSDMVLTSIRKLSTRKDIDIRPIIISLVRMNRFIKRDAPKDIADKWALLLEDITGSDFDAKLKRYVTLNLMEDEYDGEGKRIDISGKKLSELAEEVIKGKSSLNKHFQWLMTQEAQNGYKFGYILGQKDSGYSMLNLLVEEQRKVINSSLYFLSGYCRAYSEANPKNFEQFISNLSKESGTINWVPELIWRSGLTDDLGKFLIDLFKNKKIRFDEFQKFKYGAELENLSENTFLDWINVFLEQKNYVADSLCLDFCNFYFIRFKGRKKLPRDIILEILLRCINIKEGEIKFKDQMDDYNWKALANEFLNQYTGDEERIAKKMIEFFGEDTSITRNSFSTATEVLEIIMSKIPVQVWNIIVKHIGTGRFNHREFNLTHWLRGGKDDILPYKQNNPPIELIPFSVIQEWVDKDPTKRAPYLATFVPKSLFINENRICYAREILIHYGNIKGVKSSLMSNFYSEGWIGPGSVHFQSKKDYFVEYKRKETSQIVIDWVDDFISELDLQIIREKIEEEREDR